MSNISASLVLATRPTGLHSHGIATLVVECPVFVWTELLTHKRIARNASSSRAESFGRHAAHGYYKPDTFYAASASGMGHGDALPDAVQADLDAWWIAYHADAYERAAALINGLKAKGHTIAKEQINRLLPTTKMLRGVVTATEAAWAAVLALRTADAADPAMQDLAHKIKSAIAGADWQHSNMHVPCAPIAVTSDTFIEAATLAAARLARTSYGAPGPGQRSDAELAADLLAMGHLSPFEHCACWEDYPAPNALCIHRDDKLRGCYGWENHRAKIEEEARQALWR